MDTYEVHLLERGDPQLIEADQLNYHDGAALFYGPATAATGRESEARPLIAIVRGYETVVRLETPVDGPNAYRTVKLRVSTLQALAEAIPGQLLPSPIASELNGAAKAVLAR